MLHHFHLVVFLVDVIISNNLLGKYQGFILKDVEQWQFQLVRQIVLY